MSGHIKQQPAPGEAGAVLNCQPRKQLSMSRQLRQGRQSTQSPPDTVRGKRDDILG